ncbi:MAG: 16S rRNA (guanine(966)-N(2))-methyltransferase RsmD [Candidatus Omnitrophota bacterium]|nr:16S rRNA (guanine(966)-N(2))-methyltransferase RsmD [Candidatus Omnitrophota bacterium]
MPRGIRPTQNKVRKAVFDILGDVSGLSFLELFAGSGAVGLEAASRGAVEVELVELDRAAQKAIEENIRVMKLDNCCIRMQDSAEAVRDLFSRGKKFDLIFLDPPYYREFSKKTLQTLSDYDILQDNGLLIVQHFKKDELPDTLGVLSLFKRSRYGDTVLSFYRKLKK